MTKRSANIIKGWSIGIGAAVILGTVGFLTSAKSPTVSDMDDIYVKQIIQTDGHDSFEYPSLFDASVITNIPVEDLREAIRTNSTIDGYHFDVKND